MQEALNPLRQETIILRLHALLKTSGAMRLDFGRSVETDAAKHTLGREKMQSICSLLDAAINSAQEIFGKIDRIP